MPINLANVNITLAQFQEISSGKYNAGEVKLAGEQSLAKMNNHVHLWRKNVETISHEEAIAIKEAFVRTLAQSGVGADAVNAVRRELGLASGGPTDRTLHERSVKPLSRQQIREILDRNAAAINAAKGDGTIRTDAEIHAGMSRSKLSSIAAKRTATDTATASSRATTESVSIVRAQTVISGDIDFHPYAEREKLLETALSQKKAILERSRGNPSTTPDASITFQTDAGHSVELKLGMSEAAYIEKLDNMILRLRSTFCPNDNILAIRAEFLALKEPAALGSWLNGLPGDHANGGLKARTVAVLVMQERGITDSATLSLVNRISDADAIAFLSQLLSGGRALSEDSLRQSPMLSSFVNRPPVNVPRDAQTHIPDLTAPQYNDLVYKGFLNNPDDLPESFHKMACEVRDEVASRLGEKSLEPNGSLRALLDNNSLKAIFPTDGTTTQRVTPASIRQEFLDGMLRASARRLLVKHVIDTAAHLGTPLDLPFSVANSLIARHPNLIDEIAACGSPDDVTGVFARFNDEVTAAITRQSAIERCKASAEDWAREAFAAELDLPVALMKNPDAINVSYMTQLCNNLADKIGKGKIEASTPDEIQQVFRDRIADFARERAGLLRQIDTLQLSPSACDGFRTILFSMNKTNYLDFNAILASAQRLDFSSLTAHVQAGASSADVYGDMMTLFDRLQQEAQQALANVEGEIGPEEKGYITMLLLTAAADRVPGTMQSLESFFARPDVAREMEEYTGHAGLAINFQSILPTDGDPATLRDALAHPANLPPLYAMSLVQACADAGLGELSSEEALALFAPGQTAGNILAEALSFHPGKVSPTLLQGLASGALRPVAEDIMPLRQDERVFLEGGGATRALQLGYHQSELPKLAHAFALCRASGMDEPAAIAAVTDPTSKQMRLFRYGGRFTATIANFRKGLDLMDHFSPWFKQTVDNIKENQKDTPTAINAGIRPFTANSERAFEKFVFEELSVNKSIPLTTDDPESIFGMGKNPATRFIGRDFATSFENSVAQMSPQKRELLYAVFDVLNPLERAEGPSGQSTIVHATMIATRVLKNYDTIAELRRAGNLDRAHLIPLLYADFGIAPTADNNTINQVVGDAIYGLMDKFPGAPLLFQTVQLMMEASGETIQACTAAVAEGRSLPLAPGVSSFSLPLDALDGTPRGARQHMILDLNRPEPPSLLATGQPAITPENTHFVVVLPGAQPFAVRTGLGDDPNVRDSLNQIADRLETFCGTVHPDQLSAVYILLTQSALSPLNRGLVAHGIASSEHMPVTFTLSKDDATGAVTIRYSHPEGLPVHFHWETTVALDGSSTTTPLVFDP